MNNKLFVGNLSYDVDEPTLQQLFSQHGEVISAVIPKDRDTGRARGFAFVEMQDQAAAEAAIRGLDGSSLAGRDMKVGISQPKPRSDSGGGSSRY